MPSMDEQNKPMDIDSSDSSECVAQSTGEKTVVAVPVEANSSGKGLPYAPEGWPNPGDVWSWRVGRRVAKTGHWLDKALYGPRHLKNFPGGGTPVFHSWTSLKQYIQREYPEVDIDAFFGSFIWRVPANETASGHTRISEANGSSRIESSTGRECKAGNKLCSLRGKARTSALAARSCQVCCSEPGFCRDCCCILCSKNVDWAYEGYSFIRCEATVDAKFICGHVAHLDCALRAYLAGKVGGSINLDTQYYCRCCDNKTDLLPHITKIIKICESLDSRDDIGKILNLGVCILHGSEQERAKDLQNRIALFMAKLKHGVPLGDIWKEDDVNSTPSAGFSEQSLLRQS